MRTAAPPEPGKKTSGGGGGDHHAGHQDDMLAELFKRMESGKLTAQQQKDLASYNSDYAWEMKHGREEQGTYIASDKRFDRVWANLHMPSGQTTRKTMSQMQGWVASPYGMVWMPTDPLTDKGESGGETRYKNMSKNSLTPGTIIICPETGLHRMRANGVWDDLRPPLPGELIESGIDPARPYVEIPLKNPDGSPIYKLDNAGNPIPKKDAGGNIIYKEAPDPANPGKKIIVPEGYEVETQRRDMMGQYNTTRTTSKLIYPCSRGDYLVRYNKDPAGYYLNGNGDRIKVDANGNYDPNGEEPMLLRVKNDDNSFMPANRAKDTNSPDGYTYYLQDRANSYKPKLDSSGTPIFLKGNARPSVIQEGIFTGTEISDPRKFLVDTHDATKGFLYEGHFCHNTKFALKFKKEEYGPDDKIPAAVRSKFPVGKDGKCTGGYYEENGQKYLVTKVRNFNRKGPNADSTLAGTDGQINWTYERYELDDEWLPKPEYKLPYLGMKVALYDHEYAKVSRHMQGFLQPHHSDVQSDGASEIGMGVLVHGRLIDEMTGDYMVKHLTPLGLIKNDFLVGGKFNGPAHENSTIYHACRRVAHMELQQKDPSMKVDNWVILQREYGLARCMGDQATGLKRIMGAVWESSQAGMAGGAAATVATAAVGLSAVPVAGVAVAAALVSAAMWNTCIYQFSRRRKDVVEQEELDKMADTAQIFLSGTNSKDGAGIRHETSIWGGQKEKMSCLNFVGLKNDIYATIRGYLGSQYFLTEGVVGQSELSDTFKQRIGRASVSGVAAAGFALTGLGPAGAVAGALGTSAAAVTAVAAVAAPICAAVAGTYLAFGAVSFAFLKFNELGKEHAQNMTNSFMKRKKMNEYVFTDENYGKRDDMHKVF